MATRALIGFLDDDNQFVSTYNHYDGYEEGLGKALLNHYNDEREAEKVASTGYISSIDIETGEINSKYDEEPNYKVIDTDDAFTAGMMIGDEIDSYGADYGYIWVKPLGKWLVVQNRGGVSKMAGSLQDELESSGMFIVDESKKEDVMEEAGYEAKWAQFLLEAKDVDFNVIKAFIKNSNDGYKDGSYDYAIDAYIDSLKNSFRLGAKEDYADYEMDDYVEDFDNYVADRMDG
jgi:hypothetical protein|tara:strand:- start:84 stop:782 length:699 start_codon:yes stop_codon:yes gene_type:complete